MNVTIHHSGTAVLPTCTINDAAVARSHFITSIAIQALQQQQQYKVGFARYRRIG